jgi:hypothetical protein
MDEKEQALSEIKTLIKILNTWGNTIVPSLNGKETTAHERLFHFVNIAQEKFGMTMKEIGEAIS